MTTHSTKLLLLPLAFAGFYTHALCKPTDSPGPGWKPVWQAEFAAPRKLKAGEDYAGHMRYYPSPVLHDIDGDKRADLVIGDLMGKVTWAKASADKPGTFEAEQPLKMRDGEPLKFSNW